MPRSALGLATGSPSTATSPRVGLRKPATALSSVDFPQPDGPMMETNSPGSTWIEASRTASTAPSNVS
jgi:hypothetical protein